MKRPRRTPREPGDEPLPLKRSHAVILWLVLFGLSLAVLILLPSDKRPAPLRARKDRRAIKTAVEMEKQGLWRAAAEIYERIAEDPATPREQRADAAARMADMALAHGKDPARALPALETAYFYATSEATRSELKRRIDSVSALLPGAAAAPTPAPPAEGATEIGHVGATPVTLEEILFAWGRYNPGRKPTPQELEAFVPDYMDELLLTEGARRRPDLSGEQFGYELRFHERRLLAQALGRTLLPEVADAEARAAFDADPEKFRRKARVELEHVVAADTPAADAISARLAAGETFEAVAAAPGAGAEAGRIGWVAEDDAFIPQAGAIPGLALKLALHEAGYTTGPVASPRGRHWFRVRAREAPETKPFEQAAEEVKRAIQRERYIAAREKTLADLRKEIPVELRRDALREAMKKRARQPAPAAQPGPPAPAPAEADPPGEPPSAP